jgi:hypothetical protein
MLNHLLLTVTRKSPAVIIKEAPRAASSAFCGEIGLKIRDGRLIEDSGTLVRLWNGFGN